MNQFSQSQVFGLSDDSAYFFIFNKPQQRVLKPQEVSTHLTTVDEKSRKGQNNSIVAWKPAFLGLLGKAQKDELGDQQLMSRVIQNLNKASAHSTHYFETIFL